MEDVDYLSVSKLNKMIKGVIEGTPDLKKVYLKGELSNFKAHTKGHLYFSLKDENCRINGMMFSFKVSKLNFKPENGMTVLVVGDVSIYETAGSYNIIVTEMIPDGIGNLHIAFEQLKKELSSEGLFDSSHKQKIPRIPKKIGVITAPTGAAIKDIISTLKRRFPLSETLLFPALVQGEQAKFSIVEQLKNAIKFNCDVIILGRGGGSIEDLWAFNEEMVAREIYKCPIPIISAVGHEIDYTISDFVADLRAPTPTAAAELAVPNKMDIIKYLGQVKIRLNESLNNKVEYNRLLLKKLSNSYLLTNPVAIYDQKLLKLDNLKEKMESIVKNQINHSRNRLNQFEKSYYLSNPRNLYLTKATELKNFEQSLNRYVRINYDTSDNKLQKLLSNLELLNPLSGLKRGYAIVKKDDHAISSIGSLSINDEVLVNIKDGTLKTKILHIEENKHE